MKIYKKGIAFVLLLLATVGCSDQFLKDMKDYAGFNEQTFQDELMAQAYVDYLYNLILPGNNGTPVQRRGPGDSWSDAWAKCTEELGGKTDFTDPGKTLDVENAPQYYGVKIPGGIGNNTWTRIREANLFLANIDQYGNQYISYEKRNKLKGQVFFWRAWQYFELIRLYGGVPIVLVPQNPIIGSGGNTEMATPRSATSKCIEQICADLDSAVNCLPGKMEGNDWGRISKGADAALKGRVLLTWASPVFNRTDDRERWQKAYDANVKAKEILDANGYGLYGEDDPGVRAKTWHEMFIQDNKVNPEAIIVFLYSTTDVKDFTKYSGWEKAIRPGGSVGGSASIKPPVEMIDMWPMADGKKPGESSFAYDSLKFFLNRDPRFYRTFAFTGSFWPYKDSVNNATIWSYCWYDTQAKRDANTPDVKNMAPAGFTELKDNATGVYVRKMSQDGKIASDDFGYSGIDFMEFRYAELLLNLAECATGIDRMDEAYEVLKRIRKRASLPAGTDGYYGLKPGMSRAQMFEALLYERRVEFAYEGQRFYDLHRWMLFDGGGENSGYVNGNTCDYLGVKPLNGGRRTGMWLLAVDRRPGADSICYGANKLEDDPIYREGWRPKFDGAEIDPNIGRVDPDADDEVWNKGLETLAEFYDNHLKRVRRVEAVDGGLDASPVFKIDWKSHYYLCGIRKNILEINPYLEQTKGWEDLHGGAGTFDPLK